jgi:hypothetical protein
MFKTSEKKDIKQLQSAAKTVDCLASSTDFNPVFSSGSHSLVLFLSGLLGWPAGRTLVPGKVILVGS